MLHDLLLRWVAFLTYDHYDNPAAVLAHNLVNFISIGRNMSEPRINQIFHMEARKKMLKKS